MTKKKSNCWEFKKCGREPGGTKVKELGICPAALTSKHDGTNEGSNGGRICWRVAGTFCGGKVQGTSAQKLSNCAACDFYHLVKNEEEENFQVCELVTLKACTST